MNENIKTLLEKVSGDEALLAKFSACASVDEAYDLASGLIGGFTKEEFIEAMTALNAADDANISDEDLTEAAGGAGSFMSRNPKGDSLFKDIAESISKSTKVVSKSVSQSVSKVSKALAV